MDKHQSNAEQDAVFVRNFAIVLLLLTGIGVGVYFLANSVYSDFEASQRDDAALAARVAPVGQLNTSGEAVTVASTAAAPAAAAPTAAGDSAVVAVASSPGEATYNKVCIVCHGQGIAGAPKTGDAAAWEARIAQGKDTLYKHAIEGYQGQAGVMPAKGGAADLSDDDVKAAVDFMLGGGAPAAPAAPAAAEPAAQAAPAAEAPAAAAPAVADTGAKGKEIYDGVCFVCHTPGAAGAPKVGDAAAWGPRVAQGNDVLYDHAINGFMGQAGMMPPKGGRPDISDDDVKAAVDYMVNVSK
jgi:cytochrome c5